MGRDVGDLNPRSELSSCCYIHLCEPLQELERLEPADRSGRNSAPVRPLAQARTLPPIRAGHVDMHARLFAGEEVKPEGTVAEYGEPMVRFQTFQTCTRSPNGTHQ
jgi:hypothetical protein